jgi:hypothetical protein
MTKAPKLKLEKLINSPNIADDLSEQFCAELGQQVVTDMARDRASRTDWEERHAKAMKLALQVQETKSFPWTNCSNVKFPLLTIAVLQFLARISIMTKGMNLAKVSVLGPDATGEKYYQAKRLSKHLSLQLVEEDKNWRDSDEQAKFSACLLGSSFKKTYPDLVQGCNISEHVPAMDLIIDYGCKDIDKAQRITHIIPMSGNTLQENHRRGIFLENNDDYKPTLPSENYTLQQAASEATGIRPGGGDTNDTYEILEQHLWLDLDGDGYREPYIASVRHDTAQLLRLVARFTDVGMVHRIYDQQVKKLEQQALVTEDMNLKSALEKQAEKLSDDPQNHIVRIDPQLYFTRILFIPSPDGGIYGLGLGALLGPMNESVDTLTNQLIDAGTMSTTAGGFLGRGVKLKGGKTSFDPFEWKPVDSTGNDLRQNIFPLPVREPSAVLFQLLGMLVTYSEKISGATDIMTGVSPGQNTPAETSRNTVEQGMMLFSGIYARMYRGFTEELRKIMELNRVFLPMYASYYSLTSGPDALLMPDDCTKNSLRVVPAASPEVVSMSQRREKAGVVLKLSETTPGFNKYLVVLDFLEAYDIEGIDDKYPDPKGKKAIAPPPNLKMLELQAEEKQHADEMQLAIVAMKTEIRLTDAKVMELSAKATKELAEAKGVDTGHQIEMIKAQLLAAKEHKEGLLGALTLMQKSLESNSKLHLQQQKQSQEGKPTGAIDNDNSAGSAGMAEAPSDAGAA